MRLVDEIGDGCQGVQMSTCCGDSCPLNGFCRWESHSQPSRWTKNGVLLIDIQTLRSVDVQGVPFTHPAVPLSTCISV